MLQRVLIVDPQAAGANVIAEQMRVVAKPDIWTAPTNDKGLKLAGRVNPQIVFVELSGDKVDGIAFTERLRRSEYSCRKAPVILVTGAATPGAILAARDAGVHEFLRKPFIVKDLVKRLEAVTLHQRDWIEAVDYVGPDRRRFNSGDYAGPLKRHTDTATPDQARIGQALKILKSALNAVERDRVQALRALVAQTNELEAAAKATGDEKLLAATTAFHQYLYLAGRSNAPLHRAEVERRAVPLLAYMPPDYDERRVVRL
jgi:CheY-like chemotaxis protein